MSLGVSLVGALKHGTAEADIPKALGADLVLRVCLSIYAVGPWVTVSDLTGRAAEAEIL